MDLANARSLIKHIGWLASRPTFFVDHFLSLTSLRQIKKGEFAHHIGDGPGVFYGIVTGALLVLVPYALKGVQYGHISLPGDWFGAAAAIAPIDRQVAFEAATETLLLTISASALNTMLSEFPDSARHVMSLVMSNQLAAIRTSADLQIPDPRKRLAARLLTLSGLKLNEQAERVSSDLPLTQEHLAAMSCMSRISVNRILSEFETLGLCRRAYGNIHISDLGALEDMLAERSTR
jgi:CRP-like cAMP-binding protein